MPCSFWLATRIVCFSPLEPESSPVAPRRLRRWLLKRARWTKNVRAQHKLGKEAAGAPGYSFARRRGGSARRRTPFGAHRSPRRAGSPATGATQPSPRDPRHHHKNGRRHVHRKCATERVRTILLVHHAPGLRRAGQCYYKTAARRLRSRKARADGVRVLRKKLQEGGSCAEERARFGPTVLALGACGFARRAVRGLPAW